MAGTTIIAAHVICGTDLSHFLLHGITDVNMTEPTGKLSPMEPMVKGYG